MSECPTLDTVPPRVQKTEPHGAFAFFDVPPGAYSLTAQAGAAFQTQTVAVAAGQVLTATFALTER